MQKDLEKYIHKIEDLTGTPPTLLKKVKDPGGSSAGASLTSAGGAKGKDSNLIDNLGQGEDGFPISFSPKLQFFLCFA